MSESTRDDVVRMAREAGFQTGIIDSFADDVPGWPLVLPIGQGCFAELEKFYALAAAAEREACIEDVRTVGGRFAVECEALIRARGHK